VTKKQEASLETRSKLLDAAMHVMRVKGYEATTVDDICRHVGLTKGSFFHHFKSKQDLALAAASHFSDFAVSIFASAPYHAHEDPLDRLIGYVDFRIAIMQGRALCEYTCLLGMFVQELYDTHPDIRAACEKHMHDHIAELTRDVERAIAKHKPAADFSAESVGYFMQVVLQGSLIFAKAKQSQQVAIESLQHLRRYLELLFR
jgi:TetR/AcrR family transcriptional regulator, transcriptional repressor for nem operon